MKRAIIGLVAAMLTLWLLPSAGHASVFGSPHNDDFANRTMVSQLPFGDSWPIDDATIEPGEQKGSCAPSLGKSTWYQFTPTHTATYEASAMGGVQGDNVLDTSLTIWTGTTLGSLTEQVCNTGPYFANIYNSGMRLTLQSGTTYLFQLSSDAAAAGSYSFNLREQPANDDFADATALTSPIDTTADTGAASLEPGEPGTTSCSNNLIDKSVWYTFTPQTSSRLWIALDTLARIAVYAGNAVNALTEVQCADPIFGHFTTELDFVPTPGTTYHLQVGNLASGGGAFGLHLHTFHVDVAKSGTGSGTVTSTGGTWARQSDDLNCGTVCSLDFLRDTQITLSATPAAGSTFTGWSLSGASPLACNGTGPCLVALFGDEQVTANFTLDRAPSATAGGPYTVDEGSTISLDGSGTDPDGDPLSYSWSPATHLSSATAATPTFTATDDGSTVYTLSVTDPYGLSATSATSVTVRNVAPTITALDVPTEPVATGSSAPVSFSFTDPGTLDTHCWSIAWGDGATTHGCGESPISTGHQYGAGGTYRLALTVTDDDGGADTRTADVVVNRPPTAAAGGPYTVIEGSAIVLDGNGADPDGDALTYAWSPGTHLDNPQAARPTFTAIDDGVTALQLAVTDTHGASATSNTSVTVLNAAPSIDSVAVPLAATPVGASVPVQIRFSDPGLLDTHCWSIAWGDGGTDSSGCGESPLATGHVYAAAGTYQVSATVTDDDGGAAVRKADNLVVVYDPSAGFVTGGGAIDSSAGAYPADPSVAGRASFELSAKYQKGASAPVGDTEFAVAGFEFASTSYDWLVVSGARAQVKGIGDVNGLPGYGFLLTARDGRPASRPDAFRVKIWRIDDGTVVYDNARGSSDAISDADPQPVAAGSIVIHTQR